MKTSGVLEEGKTIKIKFSGSGKNIGKRLKVSKEIISWLSSDLGRAMKPWLKVLQIYNKKDTRTYQHFLESDWKFLAACVCALGAANEEHACTWGKCARLDRCDTSKHWSILNAEKEHVHWKKYKSVQS